MSLELVCMRVCMCASMYVCLCESLLGGVGACVSVRVCIYVVLSLTHIDTRTNTHAHGVYY